MREGGKSVAVLSACIALLAGTFLGLGFSKLYKPQSDEVTTTGSLRNGYSLEPTAGTKAADFRAKLHDVFVVNAMLLAGTKDQAALDANAKDIGDALGAVLGSENGMEFAAKWKGVNDVLASGRTKEESAGAIKGFAVWLEGQFPSIADETVVAVLSDAVSAVKVGKPIVSQMAKIADMLAIAVVRQFPEGFREW